MPRKQTLLSPTIGPIRAMTFLLVQYVAIMRALGVQGKDKNLDLLIGLTDEAINDARRYLGDKEVDQMLERVKPK